MFIPNSYLFVDRPFTTVKQLLRLLGIQNTRK